MFDLIAESASKDTEAATTIISTIISTVVASIVAVVVGKASSRTQERQNLEDLITKIIEISIEYPYLEDDHYCSQWHKGSHSDEKSIRYDNYCCVVFNLLERVWKHCKGNIKKIEDIIYVKEMALRHKYWWISSSVNKEAYGDKFQTYISSLINRTP